jgi:hypothetical protein
LALLAIRFLWRSWTHPANVLGRQAASMNWVAIGSVKDNNGSRSICFIRDGVKVMITFSPATVVMINPTHPKPFADFIALERWLAQLSTDQDGPRETRGSQSDSQFSPSILEDFAKDISSWPPDQARIALLIVRSTFTGDSSVFEELHGELTVGQLQEVMAVIRKVSWRCLTSR